MGRFITNSDGDWDVCLRGNSDARLKLCRDELPFKPHHDEELIKGFCHNNTQGHSICIMNSNIFTNWENYSGNWDGNGDEYTASGISTDLTGVETHFVAKERCWKGRDWGWSVSNRHRVQNSIVCRAVKHFGRL